MSALVDKADRSVEPSSDASAVLPSDAAPSDVARDGGGEDDAPVDASAENDGAENDGAENDGAENDGAENDEGAGDARVGSDGAGDIDGVGTPDGQAADEAEDDAMAGDEASQNGQAYDDVGSVPENSAYDAEAHNHAAYDHAGYEHAAYDDAYEGAEHVGAPTEFADHGDAEETAFVAAATGDRVPRSSGTQVVQDAPAPTRADLRIDFGAHLEANYRRLVAQLYAITLDPAEAHSVVQDAYSRAWRSWASISRMPDPTGWVRRVAVRSTMRSWRRFRLKSRRPVGPGPDTSVGAVLAALRRLPPSERRCVVLHHMAGAPLPEIAAVEGLSVGTTAARLARAQQVVSAGLVDVLADGLGPEPHALDGWATPEWDGHRVAATGALDDEEDHS